jgi:coenzyme F420-reducing hydrogenase alpha subunit
VTATPHIAAVHFGEALESLQRAYFNSTATPGGVSKILDDQTWEKIRTSIESSLESSALPSETREIFKNKIRNLNSRSQHSTGKDLVNELGLVLSRREEEAHDARHASAHGKDDEVDIEWIR